MQRDNVKAVARVPEAIKKLNDDLSWTMELGDAFLAQDKDIMDAMNPLTGAIYLEAIEFTRLGREMCCFMYGKYPHPSTLIPGGVTTTLSTSTFNEFYTRLIKFFDYSKKIAFWWDDLMDFFLEANPAYERVGARPNNLIQTGIWDDPEAYDASAKDLATRIGEHAAKMRS